MLKEVFWGKKKMMPDENLDLHKEVKSSRNSNYVCMYVCFKIVYFSFLVLLRLKAID